MKEKIAITNRHLCEGDFLAQVEKICQSHPHKLILREKDLSEAEYTALARAVLPIAEENGVKFTVHQFISVGIEMNHPSIHLPMAIFRTHIQEIRSAFTEITVSVHSLEEALEAEDLSADGVIFGHIFPTKCKENLKPRGLNALSALCEAVSIPVYALGGLTEENIPDVLACSVAGLCQMSEYMRM